MPDQPQPTTVTLSSVANAVAAQLGAGWQAQFPGIAEPREVWLNNGHSDIGIFDEKIFFRIVIWVGGSMRWRQITEISALHELSAWFEKQLKAQETARLADEVETRRRAALPVPDVETILTLLATGKTITAGGGRYNETFYWQDGKLQFTICDEAYTEVRDATREDLTDAMKAYPDQFRKAVGILK